MNDIEVNYMNELTIDFIRELCATGKIKWTIHVLRKLQERGIYREDVYCAIGNGKIIEQYPEDYPYPSCLVFGKDLQNNPLHMVIGSYGTILYLVTAYTPDSEHFHDDYETRKGNE